MSLLIETQLIRDKVNAFGANRTKRMILHAVLNVLAVMCAAVYLFWLALGFWLGAIIIHFYWKVNNDETTDS